MVLHIIACYCSTPKKLGIAIGALGAAALAGFTIYKLAGSKEDPPRDRPDVPERFQQMRRLRMRVPRPARAPPLVDRLLHREERTR